MTLHELSQLIYSDISVKRFIEKPKEVCYECVLRIMTLLSGSGIYYKPMGLLFWKGLSADEMPMNHYIVVCQIGYQIIVIDPTITQFGESEPFLGDINDWVQIIKYRFPFNVIKAKEYNSLRDAYLEIGCDLGISPIDFDGEILQITSWYKKIIKNPAEYRRQHNLKFKAKHNTRLLVKGIPRHNSSKKITGCIGC